MPARVAKWYFDSDYFDLAKARLESEFGSNSEYNGWLAYNCEITIYSVISNFDKALEIINSAKGRKE